MQAITFSVGGVPFEISSECAAWVEDRVGKAYAMSELESLMRKVRSQFDGELKSVCVFMDGERMRAFLAKKRGAAEEISQWSFIFRDTGRWDFSPVPR